MMGRAVLLAAVITAVGSNVIDCASAAEQYRGMKVISSDVTARYVPLGVNKAVVIEMPVSHRPRVAGVSKYGVWNRLGRGICDLAMIAWYRKRQLKNVSWTEQEAEVTPVSDRPSRQ